jgi:hypothetical protein
VLSRKRLGTFPKILLLMLVVDWVFGMATACGTLPLWTFIVPNIPFGLVHVWFESQWTGSRYVVAGRTVTEAYAMLVFPSVILLQAGFYWVVDNRLAALSKDERPV